jgi:hypothetical protein
MAAVSDEQVEMLLQDIFQIEKIYSGKRSINLLADCSWSLKRETTTGENKRQKKRK